MIDPTVSVLAEISAERARQDSLWGVQDLPMGTGPMTTPLLPVSSVRAVALEKTFRNQTDFLTEDGTLTYADIILEEVFEALAAGTIEDLREELVQVAACAVKAVEAIDRQRFAGNVVAPHKQEEVSG